MRENYQEEILKIEQEIIEIYFKIIRQYYSVIPEDKRSELINGLELLVKNLVESGRLSG